MTKRDKIARNLEAIATRNGHCLWDWTKGRWGFHTHCRQCGAFVAFTASTGRIREQESIEESCENRNRRIAKG